MKNVPIYADERHVALVHLFNTSVLAGTPLTQVFDRIVSACGYRGLSKLKAIHKRSLVHRAATARGSRRENFEKQVAIRWRRSLPKIIRRMEAAGGRDTEVRALWEFYNSIHYEHRVPLGGLPASHFYKSPHWLRMRHMFLAAFGRRCQGCRKSDVPVEVDHIKPRHLYPELAFRPDNLQVLCTACHRGKRGSASFVSYSTEVV